MRGLIGLFCALALSVPAGAQTIPLAATTPPPALAKIGRILVVFEENRSFDNLFGNFPGADGLDNAGAAATQVDKQGLPYPVLPRVIDTRLKPPGPDPRFPEDLPNRPFPVQGYVSLNQRTGDLIHAFYQEQLQINNGRMDSFVAWSNAASLAVGYFDASETNLWKLASEFTIGDRMFHGAYGGSFLNHAWLVCSCAFRFPEAPADMVAQVDENGKLLKDGQVTPDGYAVNTLRSVQLHAPSDTRPERLVPPQTMPHIGDRLDAKGVSWAWYSGGWDHAVAGKPDPDFQFHHQPLAYFKNLEPTGEAGRKHLKDYVDLIADIEADRLPQVVFYKPIGLQNLHPGYANITDGDDHLADLVRRLQASPAYRDMLILITFDENGGQWDHVAPPRRDRWGPGTRIPLIAIGPTVKRGYVDHTPYDFGSILRTITLRFGAEPVAEADANAYPMVGLLQ